MITWYGVGDMEVIWALIGIVEIPDCRQLLGLGLLRGIAIGIVGHEVNVSRLYVEILTVSDERWLNHRNVRYFNIVLAATE
jgi:hypothetical protein